LSCTMCTTCYDSPELSLVEIKDIIDQTAAWGVQVFNPLGGEPFMRADIEEILSYAVKRGFYVTVTTNGTLITKGRAAAIAKIPSDRLHFNISLDGDEEANDEIRSKGMYARAIEGYQRIRAADAAAGNSHRKILANTILHARNAERFHQILDEQAKLGFDGVQILNLFRQGDEVPAEASALWFHPESMELLNTVTASLANRVERQETVGYRIQNNAETLRRIPQYYGDVLKPLEAPCWAGWKELYINADGQAIMCDGSLDFIKGGFGNIRSQTLQQLWASDSLRDRREVVVNCTTPCVQDCYLRSSSDSGSGLIADAGRMVGRKVLDRVSQWRPTQSHLVDGLLRLELSDVCPCGQDGCTTPHNRWLQLKGSIVDVEEQAWSRYRDEGRLDFGRGFMGFDVVRSVVEDLKTQRIRFGAISVRWRGEPLIHPEIEPILRHLLDAIADGEVADRLIVETDGRFLTEALARLAAHPAPQTWVLDGDRGSPTHIARARDWLGQHRHGDVFVQTAFTAQIDQDAASLNPQGLPVFAGDPPPLIDAVWLRRRNHGHYLADQAATAALVAVAESYGVVPILQTDNRPDVNGGGPGQPVISWDGKVTMNPEDIGLTSVVGDVIHSKLSTALD
jgi:MoaA/NifB/PqqE/SkfB family radical SAM enzyme